MPQNQSIDTFPVHIRGLVDGIQRYEPAERQPRPARRFAPARVPRVRRTGDRMGDAAITEAPSRGTVATRDRLYRRTLGFVDLVAAGLAIVLAVAVLGDGDQLKLASLAALPLVVLIHKIAGLYERDELVLRRSTLDEAPVLFQFAGLFALVIWLLGDVLVDGALERRQVLGLWGTVFAVSLLGRALGRVIAGRLATTERCLVIGDPVAADRVRQKMRDSKVKADVVATLPLSEGHNLAVLNGIEQFTEVVASLGIDRVILAPVSTDSADMLDLIRIAKAAGVRVSILPRMLEVVGTSVEFDDLDGMAMLGVRRFGLSRSSMFLKRAFDLVGATIGLIAISPVLAALALAIRLDSRGPVFFKQTRVGREGRRFEIFKFRSMCTDAEQRKAELLHLNETVGLFKIADDPRITRVGRFIRRTSLDELPQLFNVLRGEMSLVGPRPLVVDEDAKVEGMLRARLHLTPGMTGPWQVLGSGRVPMQEMVKIDYLYVAGWSLWADVKLLVRTVPHMLARGGM
jgi:exopolysaccharide biosynthesis polyprenyl glycosylphosphotransferase